MLPDYRTHYTPAQNSRVELVSCPYFTTSLLDLTAPETLELADLDSFVVAICIEGRGTIARRQRRNASRASGRNGADPRFGPVARVHARRRDETADELDRMTRASGIRHDQITQSPKACLSSESAGFSRPRVANLRSFQ